ncbi:hypothetical protein NSIN_20748 [Nitrosotalea sinensis]|uniref:Uncharacterized protein n=1 Tax=Nitrosotalea sinensis TaxID=1499975 RepID=A0A2H1EHX9_9ARCH|nr:hypothetical protein NSIN_20748 [Candidatus Nitrosotalea sinensis]
MAPFVENLVGVCACTGFANRIKDADKTKIVNNLAYILVIRMIFLV